MPGFKNVNEAIYKNTNELMKSSVFITDVDKYELWDFYLKAFPEGTNKIYKTRAEYDCNCCKQFVRNCGQVVTIKDGSLVSIWDVDNLEYPFDVVAKKMSDYVKSFPIKNVFAADSEKIGTEKTFTMVDDVNVTWNHFYCKVPSKFIFKGAVSVENVQGKAKESVQMLTRAMTELTLDSAYTIIELIEQDSLYRGSEYKKSINEFIAKKLKFNKLSDAEKNIWYWENYKDESVSRIRNTAIGTLLIDLSNDVDLDVAVRKFEAVMAPSNYKRPKAIFTKKMVEDAEAKIKELGLENSLSRRFAQIEDITVNNVLFVDRDVKPKMMNSVFDQLSNEVTSNKKQNLNKIEEVSIDDFITNILPSVKTMEIMMENRHQGNMMSLIAPQDKTAPSMLKWNNNFSWAYTGDVADSMKQNVKDAGGNVDGVLRFSIQWNEDGNNANDFDAHCKEPNRNIIYFGNKGQTHSSSGKLDVDIIHPHKSQIAVENIIYTDLKKMPEGVYEFQVNNFCHRGGVGFNAEIEFDGQIFSYSYNKDIRNKETLTVATVMYSKKLGFSIVNSIESSVSSKQINGISTNQFSKVSMCMFSPNYWDEQKGIGNKHYLFMLNDCKNDTTPRGFFNEFLNDSLTPHRKVFEALGNKMRVEASDNQLSGLGFSSTQRNSIIAKIDGAFTRTIKINF